MKCSPSHGNMFVDITRHSSLGIVQRCLEETFINRLPGVLARRTFPPPFLQCSQSCREGAVIMWIYLLGLGCHVLFISALCAVVLVSICLEASWMGKATLRCG